jgi:hypothetical protein
LEGSAEVERRSGAAEGAGAPPAGILLGRSRWLSGTGARMPSCGGGGRGGGWGRGG